MWEDRGVAGGGYGSDGGSVVTTARQELADGGEPREVLDRVFAALSKIRFDQPRRCTCGTVLAERGWRGKADMACPACGLAWRLKGTDTRAGMKLLTPLDQLPPADPVLLIVDELGGRDAKRQRDRRSQAVLAVPDAPAADDEEALRVAMGWDDEGFDLARSRYHRVCIVTEEASPVREWVTAFFRSHMPDLVAAGGLSVCAPPFDEKRAEPVPMQPPT